MGLSRIHKSGTGQLHCVARRAGLVKNKANKSDNGQSDKLAVTNSTISVPTNQISNLILHCAELI